MTDDAIMDLLNTDKISIFIENIGDFIKSDYFKNLTPYALKGIEYSLKERNIPKECQNDIIEFLERLANSQSQTALRNQVYYREKLYWHLIARKITNPNDKMNISIIRQTKCRD